MPRRWARQWEKDPKLMSLSADVRCFSRKASTRKQINSSDLYTEVTATFLETHVYHYRLGIWVIFPYGEEGGDTLCHNSGCEGFRGVLTCSRYHPPPGRSTPPGDPPPPREIHRVGSGEHPEPLKNWISRAKQDTGKKQR